MEKQLQFEEAEKILRDMHQGIYKFHNIEHRPISVITLENNEGVKMYYAPPSLY